MKKNEGTSSSVPHRETLQVDPMQEDRFESTVWSWHLESHLLEECGLYILVLRMACAYLGLELCECM